MGREWPTRSFKSGNSVAVRIPAGLGRKAGRDWVLIERDDELVMRERATPKRKFNIAKVAGSATSLRYLAPEEREFEPRPSERDGSAMSDAK